MTDIAVVIPTWDMRRALTRVIEMMRLEHRKRARYYLVTPHAENLPLAAWPDWLDPEDPALYVMGTNGYLSPVEAMAAAGQLLMAEEHGPGHSPSDLYVFIHDDAIIEQRGWDRIIIDHFATHPACGLAGFGGGVGFAVDDIYKVPYDHRQLARVDFVSNMSGAEQHGRRVTEPMRVSALDGFSLITSREFYDEAGYAKFPHTRGGLWDSCLRDGIEFHMYDAWISCRAAELGYETWMLPIACHHEGGQTSVAREAEYAKVVARLGYESPQDLYDRAHRRVYERFQRILPIRVPLR